VFLELNGLKLPGFGRFWYFLVFLVLFCARILGNFGWVLDFGLGFIGLVWGGKGIAIPLLYYFRGVIEYFLKNG